MTALSTTLHKEYKNIRLVAITSINLKTFKIILHIEEVTDTRTNTGNKEKYSVHTIQVTEPTGITQKWKQ